MRLHTCLHCGMITDMCSSDLKPTVGSSGVVTTFRTSIVPSCASATRSVKVPPTSTPTLTPPPHLSPPQYGMRSVEWGIDEVRNAECGVRNRSEEHTSELQSQSNL